jgi:Trypsin-like peptidase domain
MSPRRDGYVRAWLIVSTNQEDSGMRSTLLILARTWIIMLAWVLVMVAQPAYAQEASGELSFSVVIIDELSPKPVPLTDFKIMPISGGGTEKVVRTDENGTILLKLPAGKYTIETEHPVNYKGRSLTWKTPVTVEVGRVCQVKLTDADAVQAAKPSARQISDEARIYTDLKTGVVSVECDFGSGTGFVVDQRGLILTNQHVTNGTRWAAVRFDRGIRINANVVQEDKEADVAVLQFNTAAFKNFRIVPLADTSHGPVAIEGYLLNNRRRPS